MKIVLCSAYRPDMSDVRSDVSVVRSDASGMRSDVSELSVRCELNFYQTLYVESGLNHPEKTLSRVAL